MARGKAGISGLVLGPVHVYLEAIPGPVGVRPELLPVTVSRLSESAPPPRGSSPGPCLCLGASRASPPVRKRGHP